MLNVIENFISEEEEKFLIENIGEGKRSNGGRSGIQRYGKKIYKNAVISEEIPEWLFNIRAKLTESELVNKLPSHITINTYEPGAYISKHIDVKESGEVITVLSLGNEATMILSYKKDRKTVILPKRSLLQLTDEERWKWHHEILPVKDLRYSIVFRK